MTDVEERTEKAITLTRILLKRALASPDTMAMMAVNEVEPEHIETQAYNFLHYLEKTDPERVERS